MKVRLSREFETYEEIMVWDFLMLLERLYLTNDWNAYKQETKEVDARFDLQDFISLSHIAEGVYQRTEKEERLLQEIKEAFRGAIQQRAVLYDYLDRVVASKWIENLVWAIAGVVLGIKKFERPFSFARDILTSPMPPQLLIPVKRHVQAYHDRIGAQLDQQLAQVGGQGGQPVRQRVVGRGAQDAGRHRLEPAGERPSSHRAVAAARQPRVDPHHERSLSLSAAHPGGRACTAGEQLVRLFGDDQFLLLSREKQFLAKLQGPRGGRRHRRSDHLPG